MFKSLVIQNGLLYCGQSYSPSTVNTTKKTYFSSNHLVIRNALPYYILWCGKLFLR